MPYKINKQKCVDCQVCLQACPGAIKIDEEGKAEIIDQEKLEQCGGEDICPNGAIETMYTGVDTGEDMKREIFTQPTSQSSPSHQPPSFGGRGFGRGQRSGQGRGMGAGAGRGFGVGPRDGRGMGRGGGGRRS